MKALLREARASVVFQLIAEVLRKDEATVRDIFAKTREFLKTGSIYRGKAIKIR